MCFNKPNTLQSLTNPLLIPKKGWMDKANHDFRLCYFISQLLLYLRLKPDNNNKKVFLLKIVIWLKI